MSIHQGVQVMKKRRYFDDFEEYPLARDPDRKKLGGVCAGIARYFEIEPLIVRIIAVICLLVATQASLIAYGLAYLILDDYSESASSDADEFDHSR